MGRRQKRADSAPRNVVETRPITLANISVSWSDAGRIRTATGRQIAHLLTAAAAQSRSNLFGADWDRTGQWIYRLRGLAHLISTDGDTYLPEDDGWAVIADLLELAAADLLADQLDNVEWPARFTVQIRHPEDDPRPTERGAQ